MQWRHIRPALFFFLLVSGLVPALAQSQFAPAQAIPKMRPKPRLPAKLDGQIRLLLDAKASQVKRIQVIKALVKGPRVEKVEKALLQATHDPDPVIRERVAVALGRWPSQRAEPRLLELYRDPKEPVSVRREAIRALGLLGNAGHIELLRQATKDPDPQVRWGAIDGLMSRPYKDLVNLTDLWLLLLTDTGQDLLTRTQAAEALGRRGDPKAVPDLLAVLEKEKPATPASPLSDSSPVPGQEGSPPNPLLNLFIQKSQTQQNVRAAAAQALGLIRDPKAIPALVTALGKDQDAYVRYMAAHVLDRFGGPDVLGALQAAVGDADYRVRRQAVSSLGKFKEPEVAGTLESLLKDPDPGVRLHAAIGLAERGNPQPLTAQAETDEHRAVRGGARAALKRLGLPLPPAPPAESKTPAKEGE